MNRANKKIKKFKGKVVSDAMNKTIVVAVDRIIKHKRYGKFIRKTKRFKVHDEKKEYKIGDTVVIQGCRPMSRDKHFIIAGRI